MNLSQTIMGKFIKDNNSRMTPENRGRIGLWGGIISIIGNLILFGIKIIFGFITNSLALFADAFHTLSDVATSIVLIFGFNVSQKPADAEHPFGHGRAETIATLIIAILMAVVGVEFIINGFERLYHPEPVLVSLPVIFIVILTIGIKELLARFSFALGAKIDSDALKGDAQHHRADVYSSILVVIALIGAQIEVNWLDGVMSIGVAGIMFFTAWSISKNAIDDILGKPVSRDTLIEITKISKTVDGVLNVHDIIVHTYGGHKYISLHVEVDEQLPVEKFHTIADGVEKKITTQMHAEVVTHVDPVTNTGKAVNKISMLINHVLNDFGLTGGFQDLRVMGVDDISSIMFEIPLPAEYNKQSDLESELNKSLLNVYSDCEIKIEFKNQILYN